jgi:ABC-2 type transport system ATP-binding protein
MAFAVETLDLTRRYGPLRAVDGLNIEVEEGELFGFVGPNGAGKTTTIKMLCGLLRPTSGTARVAHFDVLKNPDEVKSKIGLVPETTNIYTDLTARYNLEFMAKMHRVPRERRARKVDTLLEEFGLANRQRDLASTFSKGMQRRLVIAAALVHDPQILFLDELTTGLDVQSARSIHERIKDLNEQGVTVFLTTHRMHEIEELCDRVAIIDHGRKVACGTVEALRRQSGQFDIIELHMHDQASLILLPWLRNSDFAKRADLIEQDNTITVEVSGASRALPAIMEMAVKLGARVKSVAVREASLEDTFIKLTGASIREEESGSIDSVSIAARGYKE